MSNSILFAFLDYPPKSGPGSNRNYYLKQHFNKLGWCTKVLTIAEVDNDSDISFTDDTDIIRVKSRDATEVFSIAGKYPKIVEIPDRWYLWIIPALIKGYQQSKKNHFDYIYASFPAYSSTIVGYLLSKILKKPLVLDLRDPFRFRYDPENMPMHWLYRLLEKHVIKQTKYLLTTTQACATFYQNLYPNFPSTNVHVVHNGYAHEFHQELPKISRDEVSKPFILLHSGILYQIGRNPEALLIAIKLLIQRGTIKNGEFKLRFRGGYAWPELSQQILDLGLTNYVEFMDRISYLEAINEMSKVDANVLIQNSLFNLQIPSKLYDILALKKSILAVTDEQGALAKEMSFLGLPYFSNSAENIAKLLTQLISEEQLPLSDDVLQQRSRFTMNQHLSSILSNSLKS
ncbi:glycosyltransferase [Colwellia psychrerythraea]|uniref:Glycosyltransferase subfamily 4-like N-terminal domain-containing protein n=1 Tax=Colwellia psychrerythraea TaxID=28229 RepID=A0A099L3Q8_COLPS|nr:glycosyltransferase [Colwellia psychrerythraea]KGJ96787.1 hypothetical protein GAB14E_1663 [Colwellia psychrerythraea]